MKTLVILAGGKSSRMGTDKALLQMGGSSFIEWIAYNAFVSFGRIIISVDAEDHGEKIKNLPFFKKTRDSLLAMGMTNDNFPEVVVDRYPEKGPMGGLLSVFEETDVEYFSVISTDVPMADMSVLMRLYDLCVESGRCAAFLKMDGEKKEPLVAAYSRAAEKKLKKAMDEGNYKLGMAFDKEDIKIVTEKQLGLNVDYKKAFANYNTPEEYEKLC